MKNWLALPDYGLNLISKLKKQRKVIDTITFRCFVPGCSIWVTGLISLWPKHQESQTTFTK
jgi:hypothetical protein